MELPATIIISATALLMQSILDLLRFADALIAARISLAPQASFSQFLFLSASEDHDNPRHVFSRICLNSARRLLSGVNTLLNASRFVSELLFFPRGMANLICGSSQVIGLVFFSAYLGMRKPRVVEDSRVAKR